MYMYIYIYTYIYHRNLFRHRNITNSSEHSKFILNQRMKIPTISIKNGQSKTMRPLFKTVQKHANFVSLGNITSLSKKYDLLNKRNKLLLSCRHINENLLCNCKETPLSRQSVGLEIQGRWFNSQSEALEFHFLQLVEVGS